MDGAFLIDKEKDCTSRDVVNEIIKKVETNKVGHTGTLDPMATGVLLVCFGKATKLVNTLTCDNKTYEAEVTLGILTDTLDITGNVLETLPVNVTKEQIVSVLNSFIGEYEQEVPKYSAIKVNGKKLYDYARNNIPVELPKRLVRIDSLELIGEPVFIDNKVIFKIKTGVSKGTYIRSLVRDIALKLNTIGVMSSLRRVKLGKYDISECKTIDELRINDYLTIRQLLADLPSVVIDDVLKKDILNGKIIEDIYHKGRIVILDHDNLVLAVYKPYEKDLTKLKPEIMLGGVE